MKKLSKEYRRADSVYTVTAEIPECDAAIGKYCEKGVFGGLCALAKKRCARGESGTLTVGFFSEDAGEWSTFYTKVKDGESACVYCEIFKNGYPVRVSSKSKLHHDLYERIKAMAAMGTVMYSDAPKRLKKSLGRLNLFVSKEGRLCVLFGKKTLCEREVTVILSSPEKYLT